MAFVNDAFAGARSINVITREIRKRSHVLSTAIQLCGISVDFFHEYEPISLGIKMAPSSGRKSILMTFPLWSAKQMTRVAVPSRASQLFLHIYSAQPDSS